MNTQEQAIKDLESAKEYSKEFECEVVPFKDAKTILSQAIQTEREGEYEIHEIHGEGGRTVGGEKLYWAKVRRRKTSS